MIRDIENEIYQVILASEAYFRSEDLEIVVNANSMLTLLMMAQSATDSSVAERYLVMARDMQNKIKRKLKREVRKNGKSV